ncbi:MAG: carboxylating nicotinate-nucleotide diphosphorylase [Thermoguttaceae bacterium]|nr:carboxylating nicotinate-nucleotide diphosphorylase [Thermoguttaceae bacterium]
MSKKDFHQTVYNDDLREDMRALIRLAAREDSADVGDLTSLALIPENAPGKAAVVSRERGVVAGLVFADELVKIVDERLSWEGKVEDGATIDKGTVLGVVSGPTLSMLVAERLLLNFVGRLSGVATLTRRYVDAIEGTGAHIYDTRKTTLGWRRLEKYAVKCGGGRNHRTGLYDAILIKDNHLAFGGETDFDPAEAVRRARKFLEARRNGDEELPMLEIEVDSLDQLAQVLPENPDVVLLDNMSPETMREAVAMRDKSGSTSELEASGGINLDTARAKAESGVERVSVGALTHSAKTFDVGLDWI